MPSLFWIIVLILVVCWAGGLFVFHIGSIINLLLVIAVIYIVYSLLTRGGPPVV